MGDSPGRPLRNMLKFIKNLFKKEEVVGKYSEAEKALDQHIKQTLKDNQDALKFASKMQKMKFVETQTKNLMKSFERDSDEEEEEKEGIEDKIAGMFLQNLFNGSPKSKQGGVDPVNDPYGINLPPTPEFPMENPPSPSVNLPTEKGDLQELQKDLKLSPKQLRVLKDKGII